MKRGIHRFIVAAILVVTLAGCETKIEHIEKWKAQGNTAKLIAAFSNIHQDIRLAAIAAVVELNAEDAVNPLAGMFNDADLAVAHKAINAVAAIGGEAAQKQLLPVLNFKTSEARLVAVKAMGDGKVAEAVDRLIGLLDDDFDTVASAAATALGQIGNPKAIAPLAAKLGDHSYDLRIACVQSLCQLGGDDAAKALSPALGDFSENIRNAVVEAMVYIGEASLPFALEGLQSDGEFTRPTAAAVLKGLNQVPKSGSGLVWYTLAGMPQDPKAEVDPSIVGELAGIDGATDALLEAVAHPTDKVRAYAFQALETIGEPATAQAVAAAEAKAGKDGKTWFNERSTWKGAPSWRLDLWGALTALNPKFNLNPPKAQTLSRLDAEARSLLGSKQFKPTSEYIPLLIAQTVSPPELENKNQQKNAALNQPLAEAKLASIGSEAFFPLVAALGDDDISVVSSCAKVLVKIEPQRARRPLFDAFAAKVEAGSEIVGSEFLRVVTELNDPAVEPLLVKIRPNDVRAIQVFEKQYPGVRVSIIPMQYEIDPAIKAQPFRLSYLKDGKTKELKVVFRPNEGGEWMPEPPLPEQLP